MDRRGNVIPQNHDSLIRIWLRVFLSRCRKTKGRPKTAYISLGDFTLFKSRAAHVQVVSDDRP
jgi:hypothetical protein